MRKALFYAFGCATLLFVTANVGAAQDAAKIYQDNCATCHDTGANRAPARDTLARMQAERILEVIERGSMVTMANRRSAAERRALAEYLSGKSLSEPLNITPPASAMCPAGGKFDMKSGGQWGGWGNGGPNTRYQSKAGFSASDVSKLKVKWVFALPGELSAGGQTAIAGGRVFFGSPNGYVYALSADSGCVHWYFQAASGVRGALSFGRINTPNGARDAAFFGDLNANVYAVDAATGALIWKVKVEEHPLARVTASIALHNGRIFVATSSGEEIASVATDYQCCTFRGSLSALDANTGSRVWKTYLVEEPKPIRKNKAGAQMYGPAGVGVWSSPTVDPDRNVVYVTTGNNYVEPTSDNSDAFIAFDRDNGKILWKRQITAHDAYTSSCRMPDKTNCAEETGPDVDFASSAILVSLGNGKRALVAGQKSGVVHAVDPDRNGELLWSVRIGKGGTIGGVQWGSAADSNNIYVALSDAGRISRTYTASSDIDSKVGGGMFALRLKDGERSWYVAAPPCGDRPRCSPAQSAAVSAIPGVAFSGSIDGHLRAYAAADGKVIWDFDTIQTYKSVNGAPAAGGSLDGPGPSIGGGLLVVNSGYAGAGGMPGNAIIAFSVDGK
ncbi:MAG TPA: PQQ-binding-like beta-propeller repeat protein [Terriglobia bacterium]|nr:PQQ-binding-like beta-propeller repeat protein [Terriglobia bacterium]